MPTRHLVLSALVVTLTALAGPRFAAAQEHDEPAAGPPPVTDDQPHDRRPERRFDRRPMMMRGPRHGGADMKPTAEQLQQHLDVLEQINPDLAQRVREHLERNPQRVRMLMQEQWPRLRRLVELKQRDPEMFELVVRDQRLERRTHELAEQYRQARDEGRQEEAEQLQQQLEDSLREHFDVRQTMRERELARLEQRLEEMRQRIQQRREARDELIEQRLEYLTREPEHDRPEW